MRKKRFGEWLLVATMCAALAVSCGKKDDSEDVSNKPTNQAENPSDVTPEATPEVTPEETSQPENNTGEEDGNTSNVQLYRYGWNGSGVDFGKADIRGWNDNDVESPLTDESGNSLYHTEENFGSDMFLVFDLGEAKEIGTIRMATPNENILADSWAVYAGNQMNNAASSWDVLAVSSDMQLVDGVIEVAANGTYQYVMIGGYNPDDFMNAWVHTWDYMTEINFVEGAAESGNNQQNEASNIQLYRYGWNGAGVDFGKADIRGWNDNDVISPMTDDAGNSLYHTEENFGSDMYLVFDLGEAKEIGTIRMATPNDNILADSWAVYAGNQMNNAANSWDVLAVSSDMQLVNGVIEVAANGTYQYVMIGGYNPDDFMNAWVHAWDYMTEISFVEGAANQEQGMSQEETSNVQTYEYGWNGSGVDFMKSDIRGWNDNDTASLITDASGNALNDDRYLVFDFGEGKAIGAIRMETANENILEGSWAVYAGNQMNNAASSWEVLMVSSEMQLADGVIEVPVNGTYQYVMIGGHNADDFMNAWVHTWDGMTEISFVE